MGTSDGQQEDPALKERGNQQHTRYGSIRGFLNRAQHSIKSKTSRRDKSALPSDHTPETSTFQKLRQAVSLKKHENHDSYEANASPTPGTGKNPPLIPHFGGTAARANAAAQNQFYLQNRRFDKLEDSLGDRESGIGISTALSTASFQQDASMPDSIERVDFMDKLPPELASHVLSYLDLRSLTAVELVSRRWREATRDAYIWRDVLFQEKAETYATGKPVPPGLGLGLPNTFPTKDWKKVYKVRRHLDRNWRTGINQPVYLHGHQDSIYCVQFDEYVSDLHRHLLHMLTSSRYKIITGSRDKTIRVWDLQTFECSLVIGCHAVLKDLACMEEDEQEVPVHYATITGTGSSTVLRPKKKPKRISFPMNHNASILCLQYDEDILVTGSSDSTCIVHNIKDGYTPIMRLDHHTLAVLDLAFDQTYIVTCSKDMSICVWDRLTGQLLKTLQGHTGPVNAIQLRGNSVVSCSGDTRVKLWNIDTGKVVREFTGHTKGLACSQFSEDSKLIASAGNDKTIRIWDANTGECLKQITAHENLVRSLHVDSISGRLVSGSYDQDIKVWNMTTGQLVLDFPKWHASWVLGAKSDYRRIISTGQDPKILIMDFGYDVDDIELLQSTPRSVERERLEKLRAKMFSESELGEDK